MIYYIIFCFLFYIYDTKTDICNAPVLLYHHRQTLSLLQHQIPLPSKGHAVSTKMFSPSEPKCQSTWGIMYSLCITIEYQCYISVITAAL